MMDDELRVEYATFGPQASAHDELRDCFRDLAASLATDGEAVAASLSPLHGALYGQSLYRVRGRILTHANLHDQLSQRLRLAQQRYATTEDDITRTFAERQGQ
jgi:hypothetical protein